MKATRFKRIGGFAIERHAPAQISHSWDAEEATSDSSCLAFASAVYQLRRDGRRQALLFGYVDLTMAAPLDGMGKVLMALDGISFGNPLTR
jgi:hypothetical protein